MCFLLSLNLIQRCCNRALKTQTLAEMNVKSEKYLKSLAYAGGHRAMAHSKVKFLHICLENQKNKKLAPSAVLLLQMSWPEKTNCPG